MKLSNLWIFAALLPLVGNASTLVGKAIHITDGDTITVLDGSRQKHRIRLANIDCPEKKQPWGQKAKRALAGWVGNQPVQVEWKKKDRYGRIIGMVYRDGVEINTLLVSQGHCWVYRKYNRSADLLEHESKAKAARIGVWSLPEYERIPPWEWRRKH